MIIRTLLLSSIFAFATQAQETNPQKTATQLNTSLQSMTSFAKKSLVSGTELAKQEWAVEDEIVHAKPVLVEDKYKTSSYSDIFFSKNDSALINQASEYFKEGKKMFIPKPKEKRYINKKVEHVRKPLIKLSSIMYSSPEMWSAFTSIGKFNNKTTSLSKFSVLGISRQEIEIEIENLQLGSKESNNSRIAIQDDGKVIVTLRTGECVFEDDLEITKNCQTITEMIDKEIEV